MGLSSPIRHPATNRACPQATLNATLSEYTAAEDAATKALELLATLGTSDGADSLRLQAGIPDADA